VENECRSSQGCVPCSARFPSCVGLTNGLNSWPDREGTPYFVVCKNERVVYHDQCDYDKTFIIVLYESFKTFTGKKMSACFISIMHSLKRK
jgi:hypothetical protein